MTHWGGDWTEEKLHILKGYLEAYLKVLSNKRHYYSLGYIDAFAGTGYRRVAKSAEASFFDLVEDEVEDFRDGSAKMATSLDPGFDGYLFIEKSRGKYRELEQLVPAYKGARVKAVLGDANEVLLDLVHKDWTRRRAVVFLDPYGMQVDWTTLEALSETKAVDVWLLVPVGIAISRMLVKDFAGIPPKWETRLDRMLGTSEWREVFYARKSDQQSLFVDDGTTDDRRIRRATVEDVAEFYLTRLRGIFPTVSKHRMLLNSKGVALYMLCFVGANPSRAARETSLRIANYLLGENTM